MFEKLSEEHKQEVLELVVNFVNDLGENDELNIFGDTSVSLDGKGKKEIYLHAKKKLS
jgi:hypothetical protein